MKGTLCWEGGRSKSTSALRICYNTYIHTIPYVFLMFTGCFQDYRNIRFRQIHFPMLCNLLTQNERLLQEKFKMWCSCLSTRCQSPYSEAEVAHAPVEKKGMFHAALTTFWESYTFQNKECLEHWLIVCIYWHQ